MEATEKYGGFLGTFDLLFIAVWRLRILKKYLFMCLHPLNDFWILFQLFASFFAFCVLILFQAFIFLYHSGRSLFFFFCYVVALVDLFFFIVRINWTNTEFLSPENNRKSMEQGIQEWNWWPEGFQLLMIAQVLVVITDWMDVQVQTVHS